jgi:hypothetical protein
MAQQQFGFDMGDEERRDGPLFEAAFIRREALALIAEAKSVGTDSAWDAGTLVYKRVLFPNLVSWLPDEAERDQLKFTFMTECDRIELLLAA